MKSWFPSTACEGPGSSAQGGCRRPRIVRRPPMSPAHTIVTPGAIDSRQLRRSAAFIGSTAGHGRSAARRTRSSSKWRSAQIRISAPGSGAGISAPRRRRVSRAISRRCRGFRAPRGPPPWPSTAGRTPGRVHPPSSSVPVGFLGWHPPACASGLSGPGRRVLQERPVNLRGVPTRRCQVFAGLSSRYLISYGVVPACGGSL